MSELYLRKQIETRDTQIEEEVKPNLGQVGDVVSSMLTEAQLQSLRGSGWVLMDGRDVTGSKYAEITGNTTLPDARGQFLRGKNNGRDSSSGNASGEVALGTEQLDGFRSHNHGGGNHGHQVWAYTGGSTSGNLGLTNSITGITGKNGDPRGYVTSNGSGETFINGSGNTIATEGTGETRPKNITINYFIKIN